MSEKIEWIEIWNIDTLEGGVIEIDIFCIFYNLLQAQIHNTIGFNIFLQVQILQGDTIPWYNIKYELQYITKYAVWRHLRAYSIGCYYRHTLYTALL